MKLALLIAEGYVYLALIVAIFLSVPAFLIWGLVARRPFVAVVAILVGVPVAMTAGRALRALWLAPVDASGIEITPHSSSMLHATVQELARLVGAPRVHRILLGHAHNASALQMRYGWIPWRRNTLVLGYPMLATLTPDQMRAVIAHELAHLTHAHGRFSGWVHRSRRMWLQLMDLLERHRSVPAHVYALYRFYVPRFNRHAAAVSREHEVIADRLAAVVAGARVTAEALVAIEIGTYVLEQTYWTRFFDRVEREPDIPDAYAAMTPGVWSEVADQQALMNRLLAGITQASDTHPALRDRLRAIDQLPQWPSTPTASAADQFFGRAKLKLTERLAREWRAERDPDWRRQHEQIQRRRRRLAELEALAAPTAEQSFEWGALLEDDRRHDAALVRYHSADEGGHTAAGFAAGRLLLDRDDQSGIALIEEAMDADATLAERGCQAIVDFPQDHGRHADARRELPGLAPQFYERKAVPDRIAVVVLGRHNELVEAAISEVPDARIFNRGS